MLQWGLYAAALRLPFLPDPRRPRLRRHGRSTRSCAPCARRTTTARSCVAMPALHARRRARAPEPRRRRAATAQFLGPDLYFDDLFCMAADGGASCRASASSTPTTCSTEGSEHTLRINRMMTDGVVEAPGGAHFTSLRARLRARRGVPEGVRATRPRAPRRGPSSGRSTSTLDEADYQPSSRRSRVMSTSDVDPRRDLRRRVRRGVARRRRDPRQPDRHRSRRSARGWRALTFEPDLLLYRRRGRARRRRRCRSARRPTRQGRRGVDAVPARCSTSSGRAGAT